MTIQELRMLDDAEWARRLARPLTAGQTLYSEAGAPVTLIEQCPDHYGDQRSCGPVWYARCYGQRTTFYVNFLLTEKPQ